MLPRTSLFRAWPRKIFAGRGIETETIRVVSSQKIGWRGYSCLFDFVRLGSLTQKKLPFLAPRNTSGLQGHHETSSKSEDVCTREALASGTVACVLVTVVGLGVGTFIALQKLLKRSDLGEVVDAIAIEPLDFAFAWRSKLAISCTYKGHDPAWQHNELRLRADSRDAALADEAATRRLGGIFAPSSSALRLEPSSVARLASNIGCKDLESTAETCLSRDTALYGLRTENKRLAIQSCTKGSVISVEIMPGSGLLDLYGNRNLFSLQDQSLLQRDRVARAGGYVAQDFYSGRSDRIRRSIQGLVEQPQDRFRVSLDGGCVYPVDASSEPLSVTAALDARLASSGSGTMAELPRNSLACVLDILVEIFSGEAAPLLDTLIRAQCGASGGAAPMAGQLIQILQQKTGQGMSQSFLTSDDALEAAFARGFWNLSADDSGMHTREREGERLLERARRELWVEGSASRRELEKQIQIFLTRYLLGVAAINARLRIEIIKPCDGGEASQALRGLGYVPSQFSSQTGMWWRLEIAHLEVPLVDTI